MTAERTFLAAFDPPPPDATDEELDAWADAVGEAIVAARRDATESVVAEHLAGKHDQRRHGSGGGMGSPPPTDTWHSYRGAGPGGFSEERAALHRSIIESRLDGLPASNSPTLYMTGGGPASGKSTALLGNEAAGIPGTDKAAHIDPDGMKAELPEYQAALAAGAPWGAAHVHEESSYLAKSGVLTGLSRGHDVVYDSVGDSGFAKLSGKVAEFRAANPGVKVRAEYATCATSTALSRSASRAQRTGRVVPETVIRSSHADVSRTFVTAVNAGTFDSARLWDTDGPSPRLVFSYDKGTGGTVHNQTLWDAFVAKGNEG